MINGCITEICVRSVKCNLPVPLLGSLLDAPQGSPFLDAPSPKGSLDGEESDGGAGEPHASSVPTGAAAEQGNRASVTQSGQNSNIQIRPIFQSNGFVISVITLKMRFTY